MGPIHYGEQVGRRISVDQSKRMWPNLPGSLQSADIRHTDRVEPTVLQREWKWIDHATRGKQANNIAKETLGLIPPG